jgi:RNase H-like domain found in reverse transcriptase
MRLTVMWVVCCSSGREQLGGLLQKLLPAQSRYSTFDRELTAVFSALRHFRCMLEGRQFHVMTDHKPLVAAFGRVSPPWSAREQRLFGIPLVPAMPWLTHSAAQGQGQLHRRHCCGWLRLHCTRLLHLQLFLLLLLHLRLRLLTPSPPPSLSSPLFLTWPPSPRSAHLSRGRPHAADTQP